MYIKLKPKFYCAYTEITVICSTWARTTDKYLALMSNWACNRTDKLDLGLPIFRILVCLELRCRFMQWSRVIKQKSVRVTAPTPTRIFAAVSTCCPNCKSCPISKPCPGGAQAQDFQGEGEAFIRLPLFLPRNANQEKSGNYKTNLYAVNSEVLLKALDRNLCAVNRRQDRIQFVAVLFWR